MVLIDLVTSSSELRKFCTNFLYFVENCLTAGYSRLIAYVNKIFKKIYDNENNILFD